MAGVSGQRLWVSSGEENFTMALWVRSLPSADWSEVCSHETLATE